LPILVRLAIVIVVDENQIKDISELYEAAIEKLLDKGDLSKEQNQALIKDAAEICQASYGTKGNREIILNQTNEPTIDVLVKCGLLTPINRNSLFGNKSLVYKFFHDTVQTYLTTIKVFVLPQDGLSPENIKNQLYNFAANPMFKNDEADIIFQKGSEIFQMAILIIRRYPVKLEELIAADLKDKAEQHKLEYSIRDILDALPKAVHISIANESGPYAAVMAGLDAVSSNPDALAEFYYRFLQLIPLQNISTSK
jgi:hypothetical protein